ncbi:MAG TPA: hypothetical protein VGJ70_11070, partial [Solirubrobacteraceae bacterium]
MLETVLRGAGAAPGLAVGPTLVLGRSLDRAAISTRPWYEELERARAALGAAHAGLMETAARLRTGGRTA